MIARLLLIAAAAFAGIVALAHAQQPQSLSVAVVDNRYAPESPTIALGGTVAFAYAEGEESHNVHFETAGPQCAQQGGSATGPVGRILPNVAEAAGWSGQCTFSQPGIYRFYCDDHAEMTGKVTVANADGTLPTEGGTPTPTPTPQPIVPTPAAGGQPAPAETAPKLQIAASQRGLAVTANVTGGSASTSVMIEALARRTDLRATGKAKLVRVGKTAKSVAAGASVKLSVPLDAKGKAALKRLGRLKLTLKITVAGNTETKAVTLRKPAKP